MRLIINPKYKKLNDFINHIPKIFETQGISIYKGRNELKTYETEGYNIVVKKFKKPHFINRIAYGFFRPSKARRSYEHALELLKRGVPTPEPIAYMEEKTFGLLEQSYYICIFEKEYEQVRSYMNGNKKDKILLKELAAFIAGFHNKEVDFLDLSPGNILFKPENGGFVFSLIDINRLKFRSISEKERYKSFTKLANSEKVIEELISQYAEICHFNKQFAVQKIKKYSSRFFKDYHK